MKVEHHVTIHSGLNIHAPVFAESMEEAERLGREWALAQFAAAPVWWVVSRTATLLSCWSAPGCAM